jgi:hypothetical protein
LSLVSYELYCCEVPIWTISPLEIEFQCIDADLIPQGHETESIASKASVSYEAWRLSLKDVRPSVKTPLKNPRPLKGLKLRLLELLANDLL